MTGGPDPADDRGTLGRRMLEFVEELYPLTRSITGDGVRDTLRVLARAIPLEVHEVATGTRVFDWTVPREWTIRDAYIKDASGRRIVDFNRSNLHVVGYSTPVNETMSLDDLRPHLHSLPDRPSWVPYRTSYYEEAWGFCLAHEQLVGLDEGPYEVRIDSELRDGHLTYGELVLPGEMRDEILVSAHVCHPSLANDNLSGIAVATFLASQLQHAPRRHTLRFLFAPGTIGSLTWLSLHQDDLRIRHGLVLAGVGDAGDLTYKRSRQGDAGVDRAVRLALRESGHGHALQDFSPWGYDERQYNSPGFSLPVGLLMRTPHGTYPEYHTSADDVGFVHPDRLRESLEVCREVVSILEADRRYLNLSPKGEPALGRRGLWEQTGGAEAPAGRLAMLWVLNLSDGGHSLLDVAERSGLRFADVAAAAGALERAGLLGEVKGGEGAGGSDPGP